jgi:hypothetical protein
MQAVETITPDGLLALVTALKQCPNVMGNLPVKADPRNVMLESGFREHVKHSWARQPLQGLIEEAGEEADVEAAARAVDFACEKLGMERKSNRHCYTILVECMANTLNHAARPGAKRRVRWSLLVQHDRARNTVCFCFADQGLGVIETLKLDKAEQVRRFLNRFLSSEGDAGILKRVMQGEVRSSTKRKGRGLGLPKIASLRREKLLDRLVVIANRAHVDFAASASSSDQDLPTVTAMKTGFTGTMLYWEVRKPDVSQRTELRHG